MNRTGLNPVQDLKTLSALRKLIRARRPDVILPYTMKPIVWGSLAARLEGHQRCYPLFTGLGYAFSDPDPRGKRRLVRRIAIGLHRHALQGTRLGFYYNAAELNDLRRFGMVPELARMVAIPGSGADAATASRRSDAGKGRRSSCSSPACCAARAGGSAGRHPHPARRRRAVPGRTAWPHRR